MTTVIGRTKSDACVTITVQEFDGNFVCGNSQEQIDAINLPASITEYRNRVESALLGYWGGNEIEWNIQSGEGSPKHVVSFASDYSDGMESDGGLQDEEESILFVIDAVRERVFSQGEFWVNA